MARVRRTVQAKRDYIQIWVHVAEKNPRAADGLIDNFDAALDLISHFPGMGQSRDDLSRGLRSYPVGNYLLLYRSVTGGIELVRAVHGARNLRRLFRRKRF
jgi:toxin ParE1/3/4